MKTKREIASLYAEYKTTGKRVDAGGVGSEFYNSLLPLMREYGLDYQAIADQMSLDKKIVRSRISNCFIAYEKGV